MHSNGFFLKDVAGFLGGYYTFIALMNVIAALLLWKRKNETGWALVWAVFAGAMMVLASLALSGSESMVPALPSGVRTLVNKLSGPMLYTVGTMALFTALIWVRISMQYFSSSIILAIVAGVSTSSSSSPRVN